MGAYDDLLAQGKVTGRIQQTQQIKDVVSTLAPMATTYTQETFAPTVQDQQINTQYSKDPWIESAFNFAGGLLKSAGDLAAGAAGFVWDSTVGNLQKAVELPGQMIYEFTTLNNKIDDNNKQQQLHLDSINVLMRSYQDGHISQSDYKKQLIELAKEGDALKVEADANVRLAEGNAINTADSAIAAAVTVVTAASMGVGKLSTIVGTKAIEGSTAVSPIIKFFGTREAFGSISEAAGKIDDFVISASKLVNKIGTFNNHLPSGQLIKLVQATATTDTIGMTASQIAKKVAVTVLLKEPLIYTTNIGIAKDMYNQLLKGDLNGVALSTIGVTAMALSGGPIGFGLESIGKGFNWLKTAAYYSTSNVSRQSFADALSTMIGDKTAIQVTEHLAKATAGGDDMIAKLFNVMADKNMQMAKGNSNAAAHLVIDWFQRVGINIEGKSTGEIITSMVNYAKINDELLDVVAKFNPDITHGELQRIILGRASKDDKKVITGLLKKVDEAFGTVLDANGKVDFPRFEQLTEQRKQVLALYKEKKGALVAWANSETFMSELHYLIEMRPDSEALRKAINSINTGKLFKGKLPKAFRDKMGKEGYLALMPEKTYTPYVRVADASNMVKTGFAKEGKKIIGNSALNIFEQAVKPLPVLSHLSMVLQKAGLGIEESQAAVYKRFGENFDEIVKNSPELQSIVYKKKTLNGGKDILTRLYDYSRNHNELKIKRTITDLRQLTKNEIKQALNVSEKQAKQIMRGLNTSMLQVPMQLRGLGDWTLDRYHSMTGGLSQQFSRTQGAFRYEYNPFFRWQQSYQTEFLSQVEAGGKILQVPGFNKINKFLFSNKSEMNSSIIKMLEERKIFPKGFSGEGAAATDAISELGTRLIKSEKISLAGMLQLQAKRAGYEETVEGIAKYIDDNYKSVLDTMKTITVSHQTKDFWDSPLSRTINTAFFPFRFNMKVANIMAQQIGKFSAPTQVALIVRTLQMTDWLNSDEGIAWQTQYSDAIKLFAWITPTYPLSYVWNLTIGNLVDPGDASIGDLGLLGGLPFGMFSQMLQANGIIGGSQPYVDPKSGYVFPKYVPDSAIAQVNLALQSLIGATFSYPGALLGLPSKTSIIKGAVSGAVGGNDFKAVNRTNELSASQKHKIEVIKKSTATVDTSTQITPIVTTKVTNVKSNAKPTTIGYVAPTTKAKKKKKSEYIPRPIR